MPRGFLVKRYSKTAASAPAAAHQSSRVSRYSDEDRSDTSSDHDNCEGGPTSSAIPASLATVFGAVSESEQHSPSSVCPFDGRAQTSPLELTTTSQASKHRSVSPLDALQRPLLLLSGLDRFSSSAVGQTSPSRSKSTEPLVLSVPPYPPKKRPTPGSDCSATVNSQQQESSSKAPKQPKRVKAVRKLNFDEDKTSPVSGTFIRDIDSDEELPPSAVRRGDIDPSLNVVVVTEEARAELAKIENKIGAYVCQLCKEHYSDAFGLAQHRCSRIVHVEYRCPECDKVFNCPANLASHRRWHKPRPANGTGASKSSNSTVNTIQQGPSTPGPPKLLPAAIPAGLSDQINANRQDGGCDGHENNSDSESQRNTPSPGVVYLSSSENNGPEDGPFRCKFCHKKFRRSSSLKKHLPAHNMAADGGSNEVKHNTDDERAGPDTDVSVSCHCGKSFANLHELTNHALLVHTDLLQTNTGNTSSNADEKAGVGAFSSRNTLEKHVKSHSSSEIYPCKYCSSVFYSSPGLTRHINKYHPSENRQVILLQIPSLQTLST